MRDTETLVKSAHRGFLASAGLQTLCRTHAGCGGHPPCAEGQGENQPRRVAGKAGPPPSPLAAPGRESKVRAAAETPPTPARRPRFRTDLRPPARDVGRGEQGEKAGGTCLLLAGLNPGRRGQPGAWANPHPPPPRVLRGPTDPLARGIPNFLLPAPYHGSPQRPARSQTSREREPTWGSGGHRRCLAARLAGPAPPPPGPAPCGVPAPGHRLPPSSACRLARV